jgi:purine-binding chemotaxis protein CheW
MQVEARTHWLTFVAAGEDYGVEVLDVREIVDLTRFPRLPAPSGLLRCTVRLDSTLLPVIDLGMHLGLPPAPVTECTSVVVVDRDGRGERVGILAESMKVLDLPATALSAPPAVGALARAGHVAAVARASGTSVLVLDISYLMRRIAPALAPARHAPAAKVGLARITVAA